MNFKINSEEKKKFLKVMKEIISKPMNFKEKKKNTLRNTFRSKKETLT